MSQPRPPMTNEAAAPSARHLLMLAWPIIVSRSAQTVISVSDAAMIAPLGENAIAAATAGALNVLLLSALPMGAKFNLSRFAAPYYGRGAKSGAPRFGL